MSAVGAVSGVRAPDASRGHKCAEMRVWVVRRGRVGASASFSREGSDVAYSPPSSPDLSSLDSESAQRGRGSRPSAR